MSVDPPWRLDPHQRIVGVGWGGATIAVLAFSVHWSARQDYQDAPVLSYPLGDDIALLDDRPQIPFGLDLTLPQFSSDMLANGLVWAYAPYRATTETPSSQTVTVIDEALWNGWAYGGGAPLGQIRVPYQNGVPDQDVIKQAIEGWSEGYDIPPDQIYFVVWEVTASHEETQSWTDYDVVARALIFFNLPKIREAITPATEFSFSIATGPASSSQAYDWGAGAAIYKGHGDFPATDSVPDWLFSPIAQGGETGGQGPESALPAYVTRFQIDLMALLLTAEKAAA